MRRNSALGWAAIDLCTCLILVIYTLIAPPVKVKVISIPTQGIYAITQTCPTKSMNDVDLYVEDPAGKIAWFSSPTAGLMHLEQDVIPGTNTVESGTTIKQGDDERTILRGTLPGQYIVNIQMYNGYLSGTPETCTVTLYSMQHGINQIVSTKVTLDTNGSVGSAFQFTVNAQDQVTQVTHFNRNIVYQAAGG